MNKKDQVFSQRATELAFEFNRYIIEHPEVTETIGQQAIIFFEIEGDEEFNAWSHQLASEKSKNGSAVCWINIKKMTPIRSRIEELELLNS